MPLTRLPTLALLATSLVACSSGPPAAVPMRVVADPADAELVTEDLARFWGVFDRGGTATLFDREYLAPASPGLLDFRTIRTLTAADLARMVSARPDYFHAVRDRSLAVVTSGVPESIRGAYREMKRVYPPAVFPAVTLLVGRFSTMGTISSSGILVGAEFFGADASTPLDELAPYERQNVHPFEDLPIIVAHELVHVLQFRAQPGPPPAWTLLQQAFLEGSADFVGELASGGNINAWIFPYGLANEHALWVEFSAEMRGFDVSRWLHNQASPGDRPGDLGYFLGYRIAEAYYARATDKAAAVAELIAASDAERILQQSGYDP